MNSYREGKSTTTLPETTEKCNFPSVGEDKNTQVSDLDKTGDNWQQNFKAFDNQTFQFSNIGINQPTNTCEKQTCDQGIAASALLDILNEQNT